MCKVETDSEDPFPWIWSFMGTTLFIEFDLFRYLHNILHPEVILLIMDSNSTSRKSHLLGVLRSFVKTIEPINVMLFNLLCRGNCRGITRIHRLPSRPSHPYGRQPHSLIFMSTLYKASSRLPASS